MPRQATAISGSHEKRIIELIRPNRSRESYFAGSATMADILGRQPDDYDIHHPTPSSVKDAITRDMQAVEARGGKCIIYQETPEEVKGRVELDELQLKLDWVLDQEPHIFGPVPNDDWTYCLHPFDVAVHKILQAAKCGAAKDLVDLLNIHERLFPIAALAWAAPLRDHESEPDRLLTALADWYLLRTPEMTEHEALLSKAKAVLRDARGICSQRPTEETGCLYFREPVVPVVPAADSTQYVAVRPITAMSGRFGER